MTDQEVDKIVYFLLIYGHQVHDEDALKYIVKKHDEFNTHEIIWKDNEVIGYTRYNVDGAVGTIIDACVHPNYRFKQILQLMLLRGMKKFPNGRYIKYEREFKDKKGWREFSMDKFLNLRGTNV